MKKLQLSGSSGGILVFLLGLLGFSTGCSEAKEYGTPSVDYADYQVRGTVRLSTDDSPVGGATVKALAHEGSKYFDNPIFKEVVTDAQGTFSFAQIEKMSIYLEKITALELSKPGVIRKDTVDVTNWKQVKPVEGLFRGSFEVDVEAKVKPDQK